MAKPTLDLTSPLGARVLACGGRLESGQLANMRLYRRSSDVVHTRLLGEDRTLCGRSLYHNRQLAWQFIHRGDVASGRLPSGSWPGDRDACKVCSASPVIRATAEIARARHEALGTARREAFGGGTIPKASTKKEVAA